MLKTFSECELARPAGKILAVEETLRGALIPGLPDVLGRVDLILETEQELIVADWKTSRVKYTQDQVDDSSAQLLLYGELAKDFAPGKNLYLQFGVLTKTKEVRVEAHSFPFDQQQLDRTKRIMDRVWWAIQAEHFFPTPSQMNCQGCPYRGTLSKMGRLAIAALPRSPAGGRGGRLSFSYRLQNIVSCAAVNRRVAGSSPAGGSFSIFPNFGIPTG
jgi:hypothetical protein